MNSLAEKAATIAVAIVGVATLAVLVSRGARTPEVIKAAGNAFSGALATAVSPVTGGSSGLGVGFTPPF